MEKHTSRTLDQSATNDLHADFRSDPTFSSDPSARREAEEVAAQAASAMPARSAVTGRGTDASDSNASKRGPVSRLLAAVAFGGMVFGAGALARPLSKRRLWYKTLRKSKANPPSGAFRPIWTGLYAAMAYSGYRTWKQPASPARSRALALWALQMGLNASWTPLFFGARRPKASARVAAALVPAIGGYMAASRRVDKLASWSMLPYLGWSAFAAFLNAQIIRKNRWRF